MTELNQKIWANQLQRWRLAAGLNRTEFVEKSNISKLSLRNWESVGIKPEANNLAELIDLLFDTDLNDGDPGFRQSATATQRGNRIWRQPGEVFDWLALLDYNQAVVLALPLRVDVHNWLSKEDISFMVWNPQALPSAHIERTETAALVSALTELRDYRTPIKRLVVLHGPPGSGKTTLAAALMNQPAVRDYFRHGGQFMKEDDIRELSQYNSTPTLPGDAGLPLSPYQNWWEWLGNENTVGLVIIDDLTDGQLLEMLLARSGPQVRFLVTTQDRNQVVVSSSRLAAHEIHFAPINGLTEAETEQLAGQFWARPVNDTDRLNLARLHRLVNRPKSLRLRLLEAEEVGWQTLWQWFELASDEKSPLGQHSDKTLETAWLRRSKEEQHWLGELAGAVDTTGSTGAIYAGWVWQISAEEASARLVMLARRGWLEQVTESELADIGPLWASPRYRFDRDMWGFVRKQQPVSHDRWSRLRWTIFLYQQVSHDLELGPAELARRTLWRWRSSQEVDEYWEQRQNQDELGMWLYLTWARHWLQPPVEVARLVETGQRGVAIFGRLAYNSVLLWVILGAVLIGLQLYTLALAPLQYSGWLWALFLDGIGGSFLMTLLHTLSYEAPLTLARQIVLSQEAFDFNIDELPTPAAPPPSSPTASEPRSTDTGDNPVE